MKIYKFRPDVNNYRGITLCDEPSYEFFNQFDGRSLSSSWKTINVKEYEEDEGLERGDTPGFTIPVLNERALSIIKPLIKDDVEILPLCCGGEKLFGINILNNTDAFDRNNAEYKTFKDGIKVMRILKYGFKEEMICGKHIFRIPEEKKGVFVSEDFVNAVKSNHLKGFIFELVYSTK